MKSKEEIINNLKICFLDFKDDKPSCIGCSYYDEDGDYCKDGYDEIIKDAIKFIESV